MTRRIKDMLFGGAVASVCMLTGIYVGKKIARKVEDIDSDISKQCEFDGCTCKGVTADNETCLGTFRNATGKKLGVCLCSLGDEAFVAEDESEDLFEEE